MKYKTAVTLERIHFWIAVAFAFLGVINFTDKIGLYFLITSFILGLLSIPWDSYQHKLLIEEKK